MLFKFVKLIKCFTSPDFLLSKTEISFTSHKISKLITPTLFLQYTTRNFLIPKYPFNAFKYVFKFLITKPKCWFKENYKILVIVFIIILKQNRRIPLITPPYLF